MTTKRQHVSATLAVLAIGIGISSTLAVRLAGEPAEPGVGLVINTADRYATATWLVEQHGCYDAPPASEVDAEDYAVVTTIADPVAAREVTASIDDGGGVARAAYRHVHGIEDAGLIIWGWCAPDEDDNHPVSRRRNASSGLSIGR